MPWKSQAQRRKLWATNPEVAKKWEMETPKGTDLPERVSPKGKVSHKRISMPKPRRPPGPGRAH